MSKTSKSEQSSRSDKENNSPIWFRPIMFGLLIVGTLWIILFYVSNGQLPLAIVGSWNIVIAFAIIFAGFIMMMKWR